MKCPICNAWTEQLDTRKRAGSTYRRYECANTHRFTTKDNEVTRTDATKQTAGRPRKPTHTINSSNTVAVSTDTYWLPIDDDTPRNVKLQLLTKAGVAMYGNLTGDITFFTHWCPLPKKRTNND
jgi:hypothetical protein